GHTPAALARRAADLADWFDAEDRSADALAQVARALQRGRRQLAHRRVVIARDASQAAAGLRDVGHPSAIVGRVDAPAAAAFLFPGQGTQHPHMAVGVYRHAPTFRASLDRCLDGLAPHLDDAVDLRALLFPSAHPMTAAAGLREGRVAQPAIFAVSYALAQQWLAWGVRPTALLGHSIGEYVAACVAGVFRLEDALRLVALRGRLMASMPAGGMLALALPADDAAAQALRFGLDLASVNGAAASVVSGPHAQIAALRDALATEQPALDVRPLHTSHAFHSSMMDPILDAFCDAVSSVARRAPSLPLIANATGTWMTDAEAVDPDYWTQHLRRAVRFHDGLSTLLTDPACQLLEVGPGQVLSSFVRAHAGRGDRRAIASLPRARQRDDVEIAAAADVDQLLDAVGRLWVRGAAVALPDPADGRRGAPLHLPTYPFERASYWVEMDDAPAMQVEADDAPRLRAPDAAASEAIADDALTVEVPAVEASALEPPDGPVERAIADVWAAALGRAVGRREDFFDAGGSSLMAVRLGAQLSSALGVALAPSFLVDHPTIAALAAHVVDRRAGGAPDADDAAAADGADAVDRAADGAQLVCLQPGDASRAPLVLVHPAGGNVYFFRDLARALGPERPVYAFRARGLDAGELPRASIEDLASAYLALLRDRLPTAPAPVLGGSSMGGMVAYEMAQRLRGEGHAPPAVVMLDTYGPGHLPPSGPAPDASAAARADAAVDGPGGFHGGAPEAPEALARARRVLHAHAAAMHRYAPAPYDGRLIFLRASLRGPQEPAHPERAWIALAAGSFEIHTVPGGHISMHQPPNVAVGAGHLRRALAAY
ncbi:MAG: acyltransferase domain-containing protein, partial [Acidobacteriota bacterium]